MSGDLRYELCPETGIGSLIAGNFRVDLMPEEAVSLRDLVKAGDTDGAKALLASIDPMAENVMDAAHMQALAERIR